MVTGQVLINNQPARGKLTRFIDKKIQQWLESHANFHSQDDANAALAYRVELELDEDEKQVSCETEIEIGGAIYRGYDLSNDTQQAFIHSLKRMQEH